MGELLRARLQGRRVGGAGAGSWRGSAAPVTCFTALLGKVCVPCLPAPPPRKDVGRLAVGRGGCTGRAGASSEPPAASHPPHVRPPHWQEDGAQQDTWFWLHPCALQDQVYGDPS